MDISLADNDPKLLAEFGDGQEYIFKQACDLGLKLNVLINLKGATDNKKVRNKLTNTVKLYGHCVEKTAIIGIRGVLRLVISGVIILTGKSKKTRFFPGKELAVQWLNN